MTVDNGGTNSGFTVKEILLEMRGDLRSLSEQINRIDRQGSIGTKQELEDHELRLRAIEAYVKLQLGAEGYATKMSIKLLAYTAIIASLAGSTFSELIHHFF